MWRKLEEVELQTQEVARCFLVRGTHPQGGLELRIDGPDGGLVARICKRPVGGGVLQVVAHADGEIQASGTGATWAEALMAAIDASHWPLFVKAPTSGVGRPQVGGEMADVWALFDAGVFLAVEA